jgi:putative transposase
MRKVECKNKKFNAIYRLRKKYSIVKMCKVMGVSRSGYYSWIKRLSKPDKDIYLAELIKECQSKSKKTYGYRRVKQWLKIKYGININGKSVLRIMRKYGLLAVIRRPRAYRI